MLIHVLELITLCLIILVAFKVRSQYCIALGAGFNQEPSTHTEHPYCIENNPSSDVAQIHQNKFTGLDVSPKSKLSEEDHLPPTKIIDKKEAVLNNYISDFF